MTLNQVVNGGTSRSTHGVGTGDGAGTIQLKNSIIAGNVLSTYGGDIGHRENGYGVYQDNGGNVIGRLGYYSGGYSSFASTTWVDAVTYNVAVDGTYVKQDGLGTNTGSLYLDSAAALNDADTGTYTFALTSASSIAIGAGLYGENGSSVTVPTLDQRGASRSGTIDAGAYEYGGLLPDVTDPTVSVTAPGDAEVASGDAVTLSADASDDVGVEGVKFYVDGELVGSEDTSSPYAVSWDSTGASDGNHTVEAVARDAAGNSATSTAVTFEVDNTVPESSAEEPEDSGPSRGSSVRRRISNLRDTGNTALAAELAASLRAPESAAAPDREAEPIAPVSLGVPAPLVASGDLSRGSAGASVEALQRFLIESVSGPAAAALAEVGVTGFFGDLTRAALAEYQAANGIAPAAGYFGPITRAHLSSLASR